MKRADAATVKIRVQAVYRMILEGWTNHELIPHIVATYKIGPRQARQYIRRANKLMDKVLESARDRSLAFHIAARRAVLRDAKRADEKLRILRDEAQLLGLYDHGPTGTKDDPIYNVHDVRTMTDDELWSLAKRGGGGGAGAQAP